MVKTLASTFGLVVVVAAAAFGNEESLPADRSGRVVPVVVDGVRATTGDRLAATPPTPLLPLLPLLLLLVIGTVGFLAPTDATGFFDGDTILPPTAYYQRKHNHYRIE
jgi:hypothetical protein